MLQFNFFIQLQTMFNMIFSHCVFKPGELIFTLMFYTTTEGAGVGGGIPECGSMMKWNTWFLKCELVVPPKEIRDDTFIWFCVNGFKNHVHECWNCCNISDSTVRGWEVGFIQNVVSNQSQQQFGFVMTQWSCNPPFTSTPSIHTNYKQQISPTSEL